MREVVQRQGGKLSWLMRARLAKLAPPKGAIASDLLNRLRTNQGIKVRQAIWERMNVRQEIGGDRKTFFKKSRRAKTYSNAHVAVKGGQAVGAWEFAVMKEIGLRERARKFLSLSARYPREIKHSQAALSKSGKALSRVEARVTGNNPLVHFKWAGGNQHADNALEGLNKPRGRAAMLQSMEDLVRDVMPYLRRKLGENLRLLGLN
jgi:hypothetical protein